MRVFNTMKTPLKETPKMFYIFPVFALQWVDGELLIYVGWLNTLGAWRIR
jgi:hypothetical protein